MKSILWFAVGVAAGFLAAHQINQTAEGRRFFEAIDAKTRDFTHAVSDGYKSREAELRDAL